MKKYIILAVSSVLVILALSCNSSTPKTEVKGATEVELAVVEYTCPMHPEIHSHEPGQCPICGMDLVKADLVKTDSTMIK